MKKVIYILLLVSLQLGVFAGNADKDKSATKVISGKVTDSYGEALAGTKITVKETGETFYADLDGLFKLSLKAGQVYSLNIETIGYQPKEVKSSELSLFSELSLTSL